MENHDAVVEMVKKLAADLDAGDTSSVESTATYLLANMDKDLIPIIKANLGLARIVKHDLDENPIFDQVCTQCSAFLAKS
jgi:hypothetical protein